MGKKIITHLGTGTYFSADEAYLIELPEDFNDWDLLENPLVLEDMEMRNGKAVLDYITERQT